MLRDTIVDKLNQKIVDGITYSYDTTRGKWLSVGRYNILYGINHININSSRWLAVTQGIYSNNIGFKVSRKGTIVTATVQAKNTTSCDFMIMKDNDTESILTISLKKWIDEIINPYVDFKEETILRCFLEVKDDKVDYPFVILECASRLDIL